MTPSNSDILANWPAPSNIVALCTTRAEGLSEGVYAKANYGLHVGDSAESVVATRASLIERLNLNKIAWLEQIHGNAVVAAQPDIVAVADGNFTQQQGLACAVMTADCLPLLLTNRDGSQVAAIHCGWRSLAQGIVANAIATFACEPSEVIAWMGPAIGPNCFEVGHDVYSAFSVLPWFSPDTFTQQFHGKYLADIYGLTRLALLHSGVNTVSGGDYCTVRDAEQFYSYRRDGVTGRMVSLIFRV